MKRLITYFSLVLLTLSILIVSSCKQHERESLTIKKTIVEEPEITPEQACTAMLDMRSEMIYQSHIDSVYINMPVEAIIVICLNNPEYTVEDIVKEYEGKIEYYTELLRQKALIEKYRSLIKKQQMKPDTIPDKPKKDTLV